MSDTTWFLEPMSVPEVLQWLLERDGYDIQISELLAKVTRKLSRAEQSRLDSVWPSAIFRNIRRVPESYPTWARRNVVIESWTEHHRYPDGKYFADRYTRSSINDLHEIESREQIYKSSQWRDHPSRHPHKLVTSRGAITSWGREDFVASSDKQYHQIYTVHPPKTWMTRLKQKSPRHKHPKTHTSYEKVKPIDPTNDS